MSVKISIICPIYNGEKYIKNLNMSLLEQKIDNAEVDIKYLLTESNDNSEKILKEISAYYEVVKREDFSHSYTREQAIYKAKGDIIVLITQDIIIKSNKWLNNLVKDIIKGDCEAAFSRQIAKDKSIEKYTRMNNYPNESRIASRDNLNELGIKAYFYSDAASAIRKDIFIKLKGYDSKKLLTNEDMYIAYKLINNGYRIKYCADSEVIHSHDYSLKSLFKRYFDQGVFLKQHEEIYNSGASSSAISLLKFVIVNALKDKNIKVLFSIIPNFAARFLGNKLGQKYKKLSMKRIIKYTSNKTYWLNEDN